MPVTVGSTYAAAIAAISTAMAVHTNDSFVFSLITALQTKTPPPGSFVRHL
jgi:hypothetical protein